MKLFTNTDISLVGSTRQSPFGKTTKNDFPEYRHQSLPKGSSNQKGAKDVLKTNQDSVDRFNTRNASNSPTVRNLDFNTTSNRVAFNTVKSAMAPRVENQNKFSKTLYDPAAPKSPASPVETHLKTSVDRSEHRRASPTYNGFISATTIDPKKQGVYDRPTIISGVQKMPGALGWGVERPTLIAENRIITDDRRVDTYPIPKGHVGSFDADK